MKVSNRPGDSIVTHSPGSCIAVVIHDHESIEMALEAQP